MAGNYGNGGVFDYGNVLRNVNEMKNRNALTQNRLDPNSMDNRLRAAQIEKLEREATGGTNIGTTNPRDFTAESMARFEITGDRNDLVRYETLIPQKRGGVNGVLDRRTGVWTAGEIGLDQETEAARKLKAAEREGILQTDLKFVPQIESMKVGAALNANEGLSIAGDPTGNRTQASNEAAKTYKADEANTVINSQNQIGIMLKENRNLDAVLKQVEAGAGTGPLLKYLPSLRTATITLEQKQKEMALDVVGAVTFGALSKGELDLAQQKALPTDLPPEGLVQWAKDKQAANEKLMNYYMLQINHLREGGTRAEWLEIVKNKGGIDATGGGGDDDPLGLRQ